MMRTMTKRIALFLFVAILVTLLTLSAAAQDTVIIRGVCKDENGKPMDDAIVELVNLDNGNKSTVKTNKHGQYHFLGSTAGNYKVSLLGTDGNVLLFFNNVPAKHSEETIVDFELGKLKSQPGQQSGMSEEQRKETEKVNKQNEQIKKDNEKINSTNALLQQAVQQKKDKQYDAAVATMEQAVAQDQTHDIVYGSLGDAYDLDKKYPEAEAAYTKALALAPATSKSLANYHAGLALALLQQGKIDASIAECDKTAPLDPKQASLCYFNEGAILTNQGKTDDANQAFDKAIAADPTRADAYYQKGVNLLSKATLDKDNKMVPVPGTADAFNKYLELAPEGQYAQAAKDLLASIGASVQTTFGSQKKNKK
jgi:tetratricopeptide (TPR) repeat protein